MRLKKNREKPSNINYFNNYSIITPRDRLSVSLINRTVRFVNNPRWSVFPTHTRNEISFVNGFLKRISFLNRKNATIYKPHFPQRNRTKRLANIDEFVISTHRVWVHSFFLGKLYFYSVITKPNILEHNIIVYNQIII